MTVPTNNEDRDALINLLDVNYDNPGDQPESWDFWRSRNADAILAAGFRRLPVSGDNAEARAEAERRWPRGWDVEEGTFRDGSVNGFILGAEWQSSQPREAALTEQGRKNARLLGDWLAKHYPSGEPDIAVVALTVLKALHEADKSREAAPSDTDREALAKVLMGLDADDDWGQVAPHERVVFYEQADAVIAHLAARFSRTSHPVQVEVTADMVRRADAAYWKSANDCDDHADPTRDALSAALGGGDHAE